MNRLLIVSQVLDGGVWRFTVGVVDGHDLAVAYVDRIIDIVTFVRLLQPATCYAGCKCDATTNEIVAALRVAGVAVNEEGRRDDDTD